MTFVSCFKSLDFYAAQCFAVNRGIPFYRCSPHYWSYNSPRPKSKSLASIVVDDHVTTHLMRSLCKAWIQLYDAAVSTFGNFNTFFNLKLARIWRTFDCANMNGRLLGSLWLLDKLSKQAVSVNVFSMSCPLL